ncbi:MAG: hypothetical protein E7254_03935 [Lachnospiraceae bacterium]|nr:hypothetical protein [Lachnospiraceae bacterium]
MIIVQDNVVNDIEYDLSKITDKNKIIYFDIETTGFSRKYNHVYLIGCMFYKDDCLNCVQYFAENKEDEKNILKEFHTLLQKYTTVIHFNGASFDMPFVVERGKKYGIEFDFSKFESIDIYKSAKPFAKLFDMDNTKQKSFELLMNITRKDPYNGGQLIDIYNKYTETEDQNLLSPLLLHNLEDVIYMGTLTSLLSFNDLMEGSYDIESFDISTQRDINSNQFRELQITIYLNNSLGLKHSIKNDSYYISINNKKIYISVPSTNCELKYFFPNYKDYYYLPNEDMAVHKSVSAYVDKNYREKATPQNCYVKRVMDFIPVFNYTESAFGELFKDDVKNKNSYINIDNINNSNIADYVKIIINANMQFIKPR